MEGGEELHSLSDGMRRRRKVVKQSHHDTSAEAEGAGEKCIAVLDFE